MKPWRKIQEKISSRAINKIKPYSLPVRLRNKVYIFFSVTGLAYMLVFSLLLLISINYNNNIAIAGICFLIVLEVFSIFKNYFVFRKVSIKNIIQHPCVEGDEMNIEIIFEIKKNKSNIYPLLNVKIKDDVIVVNPDKDGVAIVKWSYKTKEPGVFYFPSIELSTSWPFAMSKSWTYAKIGNLLAVVPKPQNNLNESVVKIEDEKTQKLAILGDVSGVRMVNKNEKDAKISWKHTIKHSTPITYTWEKGENKVLLVYWPKSKISSIKKLSYVSSLVFNALTQSISFKIIHPSFKTNQVNNKEHAIKVLHALTLHTVSPKKGLIDE